MKWDAYTGGEILKKAKELSSKSGQQLVTSVVKGQRGMWCAGVQRSFQGTVSVLL